MNILMILGTMWPIASNNSNLATRLIPYLNKNNTVRILAVAPQGYSDTLPDDIDNIPVHWVIDNKRDFIRKLIIPIISRIIDHNGFSDVLQSFLIIQEARKLHKIYQYNAIVSTMEPYPAGFAMTCLSRKYKKILYLMDPPGCLCDENNNTAFREKNLKKVLRKNIVFTTPFIKKALKNKGLISEKNKICTVGFPIIERKDYVISTNDIIMNESRINILFCGWLCSEIRSPKYFLDIISRLDERFCIYFMGKECETLCDRHAVNTRAQIVTLPNQPYQVALNAMHDADILINIGNSVPVHMPSKTLEYINTGKPIVNFHKMEDCTTLYYTNRYPLCLNLPEYDPDIDRAAEAFVRFCTENKGRTIDTAGIAEEYRDCTPEYIAENISKYFQ